MRTRGFQIDFIDKLRNFYSTVLKRKDAIAAEEATKNSLVLPFFQMLGYDIFNPLEFVPELLPMLEPRRAKAGQTFGAAF